jgi:hypothetical protein
VEIEDALAIITLDGKDLGEDGLQADILALGGRGVGLKEVAVGVGLEFDEVRRSNDLLDFPKQNAV